MRTFFSFENLGHWRIFFHIQEDIFSNLVVGILHYHFSTRGNKRKVLLGNNLGAGINFGKREVGFVASQCVCYFINFATIYYFVAQNDIQRKIPFVHGPLH